MQTYISFLRGINMGGNKKVSIQDLKKIYESLGFNEVKTFGLSGNVIFKSKEEKPSTLAGKIERKLKEVLGFEIVVLIRTKEELEKIIKANPFSKLSKEELSKVAVAFLSEIPSKDNLGEIDKIKDISEKFIIANREIYLFFPNGYGRTKLTNNFFEKKLKVRATTRTLRVTNKLMNLAE
jgi:uncharacterized protein (DUF1697 family)